MNRPILEIIREIRDGTGYHGLAVGIGGAAGEPGSVDGLDAEVIGLPYAQCQAAVGYGRYIAQ